MTKSEYESNAHVKDFVPSYHTIMTSMSNITERNLYINSLKETLQESLVIACKRIHVTPENVDPLTVLCQELNARNKQFDTLIDTTLLTALFKGDGSGMLEAVKASYSVISTV